jgi:hypothetical protein
MGKSSSTSSVDTLYPKDENLTALENRMYGIANSMLNAYQAPLSGVGRVPILDADGKETGLYKKITTAASPYLVRDANGNTRSYVPEAPEIASNGKRATMIGPSWNPDAFFTPIKTEKAEETKKKTTSKISGGGSDNKSGKRDITHSGSTSSSKSEEKTNRMSF